MKLTLKYFGQLVDVTGSHEESRNMTAENTQDLLNELQTQYAISHIPFQLAVNQKLIDTEESIQLNEGDVVALLPPYAGG